jgi:hypothetical protein
MAKGWNIVTRRPDPNGGPGLQGHFLVAVPEKSTAIALVQSKFPTAEVSADSEASAEALETYAVLPGEVFVLMEGQ